MKKLNEFSEEDVLNMLDKLSAMPRPEPGTIEEKVIKTIEYHENEILALRRLVELLKNPDVLEAIHLFTGRK